MAYETIIVEIEDHVATIKLNRPDALNALNSQLLSELASALEDADGNEKVRCIILTGSPKAFAAGADYIVVGRPIRDAADPQRAASEIQSQIKFYFQ